MGLLDEITEEEKQECIANLTEEGADRLRLGMELIRFLSYAVRRMMFKTVCALFVVFADHLSDIHIIHSLTVDLEILLSGMSLKKGSI
mgnify:CR=1 FL=1